VRAKVLASQHGRVPATAHDEAIPRHTTSGVRGQQPGLPDQNAMDNNIRVTV
jgi:hypothetical protein